jgi:hypothetical protein
MKQEQHINMSGQQRNQEGYAAVIVALQSLLAKAGALML